MFVLCARNRHNLDLSYFVGAHTGHLSGCRLQLILQISPLNTSVFTRQTANHVVMMSKEHILSSPTQDDNSPEENS